MKVAASALKANAANYLQIVIDKFLDYSIRTGLGLSSTTLHESLAIAGGCFASQIQGETPRDIDVYILYTDKHEFIVRALACFEPLSLIKPGDHQPSYTDDTKKPKNDKILSSKNYVIDGITFNIMNTILLSREELLAQFDYQHTKFVYHNRKLYFSEKSFICAKTKALVANEGKLPDEYRRKRFVDRGYTEGPWVNPYAVAFSATNMKFDPVLFSQYQTGLITASTLTGTGTISNAST